MTLREHVRESEKSYLLALLRKHDGNLEGVCREADVKERMVYKRFPKIRRRMKALLGERGESSSGLVAPSQRVESLRVEILLKFFGVALEEKRRDGFWQHYAGRLDVLHFEARKGYLAMVRRLHPDNGGGEAATKRMAQINVAWDRLEEAFRKHGWEG